jgi:16S rRNA (guanine966-N2)-methyltransferase
LSGNKVRIFAGRWKGRMLEVPSGARPTSGLAREALFSIVRESLRGAQVLDLYAGSGAVGLEAVSRGARRAVLVEQKPAALDRNVARLRADGSEVEVLRGGVDEALDALRRRGDRFDLIFSDPPYGSTEEAIPQVLGEVLAPGGVVIVQTDGHSRALSEPAGWTMLARRDYGRNIFFFFSPTESSLKLPMPESFDGRDGKC